MLSNTTCLWGVDRDALATLRNSHAQALAWPTARDLAAVARHQARTLKRVNGRVAVVPVYGLLEQRPSAWSYWYGGTSVELLAQVIETLAGTKEVETIVLDFDTPGGVIYGIPECAELIYQLRGTKPIIGVANSLSASAGYWLQAACEQCYITPSGDVGSVGVYRMHVDYSKALEAEGVDVQFIYAGRFKVEGNPYEPLGDEAKAHWQAEVDETYTQFVKAIARYRGTTTKDVRANYGQGRVLVAKAAVAAGMVDRELSLRDVLGRLTGSRTAGEQASAQVLRMRQAHRKARSSFRAK